jgi:hypothetical protein
VPQSAVFAAGLLPAVLAVARAAVLAAVLRPAVLAVAHTAVFASVLLPAVLAVARVGQRLCSAKHAGTATAAGEPAAYEAWVWVQIISPEYELSVLHSAVLDMPVCHTTVAQYPHLHIVLARCYCPLNGTRSSVFVKLSAPAILALPQS